jgi:AraC-like DNA-binding protein
MKITPAEGIISHIHRISPEIIRYIEENCFENITIKELAQKCFYNPSYFSTVFKAIYGKTLTEFIHEKRIQEAVRLLMETDDNIDRISLSVGYQDRKQFYKLFKDQTGITPGEMRKRTQKTTTNI